jgi:HK97 gp10 family phage protein
VSNNVTFEWDFSNIIKEFETMGKDMLKVEEVATKKAAKVVADALAKNMGRSDIDEEGYVHMQDDIHISGLKDDKFDGSKVREISGGKKTGWKWHFQEYGTSKDAGNQFITKSLAETKDEVKDIVDSEIRKELKI